VSDYKVDDRVVTHDQDGTPLHGTVAAISASLWPVVLLDNGESVACNPHYLTREHAAYEATEFVRRAVLANDGYSSGAYVTSVYSRDAHTLNVHLSDGSLLVVTVKKEER
jgi:hypothetical protein